MHKFELNLPAELDSIRGKGRILLLAVWNFPDIKTHDIVGLFLPCNNVHSNSYRLKTRLALLGWRFDKRPVEGRCKSHYWRLVQIEKPEQG
ncbi:hypothetical protein [Agarivorans sp. QJM3NY_33]|uniref:hypothetical protein n=1 Tax=Agarivorans sp. QJM3NY_33 TaxID=3421432 RepID=UPI003D7ED9AC